MARQRFAKVRRLFFLLPYIEEAALYNAVNVHSANLDDAVNSAKIGGQRVATFICPSDELNGMYNELPPCIATQRCAGPTAVYDNPACSWQTPGFYRLRWPPSTIPRIMPGLLPEWAQQRSSLA